MDWRVGAVAQQRGSGGPLLLIILHKKTNCAAMPCKGLVIKHQPAHQNISSILVLCMHCASVTRLRGRGSGPSAP